MTRISDNQVQLFDDQGRLIGVIRRPMDREVFGPGREKVYLARREQAVRNSQAA
ncbi:MAG: hypothetical protein ACKVS7_11880 [Gemmatimonadaceae bacterium]